MSVLHVRRLQFRGYIFGRSDWCFPTEDMLMMCLFQMNLFWRLTLFLPRDAMLSAVCATAIPSVCLSVRPSVCLSVTRVDQSKTAELRIMQFSPFHFLSVTLIYAEHISWTSSKSITRIISLGSSLLGATTSPI